MNVILSLLVLLTLAPARAETDRAGREELARIRDDVATVRRLHASEGFFTEQESAELLARKLERAGKIVGRPVGAEELDKLVAADRTLDRLRTARDKVVFLAGLFLVIALVGLGLYYLGPILRSVPYVCYEVAAWAACLLGLLSQRLWPCTDFWLVIPGAIAVVPCFYLTVALHYKEVLKAEGAVQALSTVCLVLWGGFALLYRSQWLGFLTVCALETLLGFTALAMPLCYCIGFRDKDVIPRAMSASFIILAVYVLSVATGAGLGVLDVFKTGMLRMGAFVYFIGCLIVSNRYYHYAYHKKEIGAHYVALQALTIASGAAALYLGARLDIPALSGIGGTFFSLYLVEKYLEIPWKKVGWAWGLLGLSLGLYYLAGFAMAHPRWFIAW